MGALREWGWFIIIHKTRPLIGLPNPEEELRILEEKANATYGVYKQQLDTKEKLLGENVIIEEEKKALLKQIEKEQGNVSQYHEKQAKISAHELILSWSLSSPKMILQTKNNIVSELHKKPKILNRKQL